CLLRSVAPPPGSTRSSNIGSAAGNAVRPRPLYLLHARRAGRLLDSPNPRAVLTYAKPGTSPAPRGVFLFCGGVLRASILGRFPAASDCRAIAIYEYTPYLPCMLGRVLYRPVER